MAVSRIGNVAIVHLVDVLLTGEKLGEDHAFALSLVCQHRRAGDITNGVDAFD